MLEKWVVTSPDTIKMELNILLKIGCLVNVLVVNNLPAATHGAGLRNGINALMQWLVKSRFRRLTFSC